MEDALLTLIVLIISWRWADWRHWKQYYPTILFWSLGNTIYCYLTVDKPLWKFTTIIPSSLANIIMALVIFPCVGLLFLPYFPKQTILKKFLYICSWTFIFSLIEWWALKINHFAHYNKWNLTLSIIFNLGMFTLIQIHYKEPRWAWLISLVTAIFIMKYFEIPLKA
ncbi:CBO0543 family protein [Desulfosporosinus sp. OT]|uniref:CBO0543 family protein n=1 Tax=Desulfosporosinus sp. OT TaxID=913865 RepID=UPI000223B169|nr:CBO0543 family protein [Desulfosporosinus sp. OT]EGW36076.1 putative membrane protein [Desulfosporosinus sp. OT]